MAVKTPTSPPTAHKRSFSFNSQRGHVLTLEQVNEVSSLSRAINTLAQSESDEGVAVLIRKNRNLDRSLPSRLFKRVNAPFYFCLLLRPKIQPQKAMSLTALATVALCRVLRRFSGKQITIGWPNKIYSDGELLGFVWLKGVLHKTDGTYDSIVIAVAAALSESMESDRLTKTLARVFTGSFSGFRDRVAQALLAEIYSLYEKMEKDRAFMNDYRALCCDREAFVQLRSPRRRGLVRDIDSEGRLVIDLIGGGSTVLFSAENIKKILYKKKIKNS